MGVVRVGTATLASEDELVGDDQDVLLADIRDASLVMYDGSGTACTWLDRDTSSATSSRP